MPKVVTAAKSMQQMSLRSIRKPLPEQEIVHQFRYCSGCIFNPKLFFSSNSFQKSDMFSRNLFIFTPSWNLRLHFVYFISHFRFFFYSKCRRENKLQSQAGNCKVDFLNPNLCLVMVAISRFPTRITVFWNTLHSCPSTAFHFCQKKKKTTRYIIISMPTAAATGSSKPQLCCPMA